MAKKIAIDLVNDFWKKNVRMRQESWTSLYPSHVSECNKKINAFLIFYRQLDAFSCHTLKKAHQKTTTQLIETCHILDDLKGNYQCLEDKLNERESYFSKRESELQELHRCEIAKGKHDYDVIVKPSVTSLREIWKTSLAHCPVFTFCLHSDTKLKVHGWRLFNFFPFPNRISWKWH